MKKILTILTLASFVILAGCASDPASVNVNAGITETQKQNENAEVVVVNANDNANKNSNTNAEANTNAVGTALELSENTITEQGSEIDTSDWLTYTNEEYGFSFKYPKEWSMIKPGSDENMSNIYLYSNFSSNGGNEKLADGEIKVDVKLTTAQEQFFDEGSLCHRQYVLLKSTDYVVSCSKIQVGNFDFLQIETEIFPSDKLPGDSLSMLYTNINEIPFQVSMDAYFGSSNGLDSNDRMIVEQIFSSMQTE